MLSELLEDRAALYVSGVMTASERENFELILAFHVELRAHVAGLQEVVAAAAWRDGVGNGAPSERLRSRVLAAAGRPPRRAEPEALVVTSPEGLIEWVNPVFTAMCGHTLEELRGRKPGSLLQGPETDPKAVSRIRTAVREGRECRETLVNYHKDGSRYRVDVRIDPILDDERRPLWFVAREHKLTEIGPVRVG